MECDNPFNTNMYDEKDGRILYQVMTEYSESMTRVVNIEGATIASWHWRDPRQETITFGNGHPVFLGSWLKKSIMPFKDSVTFQDQSGHHFKWKGWGTGQWPLELFAEDDRKTPIAWFVKSWATSSGSQRPKARLSVDVRGQTILDLIVISFLVLEKNRRITEGSNPHVSGSNQRLKHGSV